MSTHLSGLGGRPRRLLVAENCQLNDVHLKTLFVLTQVEAVSTWRSSMPTAEEPRTRQRSTAARRDEDLDLRPLLGIADVAQILGLPKATLYRWHSLSTPEAPIGPRAFRVGRYLRYTLGDVSSYIEGLRSSAS